MDWLNYHHLLYFWVVAKEGSVAQACERLQLTQPTISTQLKKLEQTLGERLFKRSGRQLELTEAGQRVYRYADEIFNLGRELLDVVKGRPTGKAQRFVVGIPDGLPKLIVYRLLKPAVHLPEPIQLIGHEGKLSQLLADLAVHRLDVVLSDLPLGPTANIRAFSHLLGECGVSVFGVEDLQHRYRRGFPQSLHGAPVILPGENAAMRRGIDAWLEAQRIKPKIVAEFDDLALVKEFGHAGLGLFFSPSAIEPEIQRQYGVLVVGRVDQLRERYYAISTERRLKHPAVLAVSEAARTDLLQAQPKPRPPIED
jgi:LysR family transcriptional activator of nhaA